MSYRTTMYHKTKAPKGVECMSDDKPTGAGWVDTPAKFMPGTPIKIGKTSKKKVSKKCK